MIEKIKISLWDLFSYWLTGTLILFSFFLYFNAEMNKIFIFKNDIISGVYLIILTYSLGVIYEPISILIFKKFSFINNFILNKIFKDTEISKLKEEEEKFSSNIKQVISTSFEIDSKKIDYFQIAKNYVLENNNSNLFMLFLSRYGLFRNISTLIILNFPFFIYYYSTDYNYQFFVIIIILIIIQILLYKRSKQYYYYSGNEIFRNFLIMFKTTSKIK